MAKFTKYEAGREGWSELVQPIMHGYKLACCDCSLVHDMEFSVLRVMRHLPDGTWEAETMNPEEYRVEFRCRRNNRSTGQMRRREMSQEIK